MRHRITTRPSRARELLREAFAELRDRAIRYRRGRQLFPLAAVLLRFAERIDPAFGEQALRQVIAMHVMPQDGYAREQAEPAHADMAKLALLLSLFGREPELCRTIMDPIFDWAESGKSRPVRDIAPIAAAMILVDAERAIARHRQFFSELEADDLRLSVAHAAWPVMASMLAPDDDDGVWRWVQKEIFHQWVIDTDDY